jgi:hypothetical protein
MSNANIIKKRTIPALIISVKERDSVFISIVFMIGHLVCNTHLFTVGIFSPNNYSIVYLSICFAVGYQNIHQTMGICLIEL